MDVVETTDAGAPLRPATTDADGGVQALLRRWFVQYNPLYLASAACVLVGLYLISDGLGGAEARRGEIALIPVVQAYELLLIAGAALLYRVARLRRPAVVLAMVEVLYICDVTFQTEVAAYMGTAGLWASAAWLAAFGVKLMALAWALRLRLSAAAKALPLAGALLVAGMPHLLHHRLVEPRLAAALIACCLFGLFAAAAALRPRITSRETLSGWGATVLRRASKATWLIWGALLAGHAALWAHAHDLGTAPLWVCTAVLLLTLRSRSELGAWIGVALALGLSLLDPSVVSCTALLAAVTLTVLGRRGFDGPPARRPEALAHPYRGAPEDPLQGAPPRATAPPRPGSRLIYVGAVICLYLSIWTLGWQDWPLPAHSLWLDLAAVALLVAAVVRMRLYVGLAPAAAIGLHLAAQRQVVPSGSLQWGALLVLTGFALLLGGVALNWSLRRRKEPPEVAPMDRGG